MKQTIYKTRAFTLIELLMVIAIIGILAGILIPTVGAVRKQANIAASKAQLSNYVTAIQMFKGEYGYFPTFGKSATGDSIEISLKTDSASFIETLSGRDASGAKSSGDGNRRQISFHSFSETEFLLDSSDNVDPTKIADRFNNTNIVIVIDANGDGVVKPSPQSTALSVPSNGIRTNVTAYVDEGDDGSPAYSLWD